MGKIQFYNAKGIDIDTDFKLEAEKYFDLKIERMILIQDDSCKRVYECYFEK